MIHTPGVRYFCLRFSSRFPGSLCRKSMFLGVQSLFPMIFSYLLAKHTRTNQTLNSKGSEHAHLYPRDTVSSLLRSALSNNLPTP